MQALDLSQFKAAPAPGSAAPAGGQPSQVPAPPPAPAPVAPAAALDLSKFKSTVPTPAPGPNLAQRAIGSFLDPIIATGVRTGQAVGELGLKGANLVSGGALDKYMKGGSVDRALSDYESKPTTAPVTGTQIPAIKDETPERVAGRAISTVALAARTPAAAGALLLGGSAMQNKESAPSVAIKTVAGAIGGKILEHGFDAVSPYIEKAAQKFGAPLLDAISQYVPDSAKTFMDGLAEKLPKIPDLPLGVSKAIEKGQEGADYVFNAPLDAAENAAGRGITWAQNKAVDGLENKYYDWGGATKSGVKNIGKIADKTAAKNAAGTVGEEPQRILAEARIIPENEGTKFATKAQADEYQASLKPLQDASDKAVKEVAMTTEPTPIDDLEKAAVAKADAQSMPAGDKKALTDHIREEFDLMREKYGDTMTIVEQNAEKKAYWKGTKFDSSKPFKSTAYYNVASSFQKSVENVARAAGHEDVAQLNRAIGDRLEAANYLRNLDGQTIKGGRLQKYVFQGIGATLGHSIPGKIVGAMGGNALAQMLISASVSSPVKSMLLRSIEDADPAVYNKTLEWLEQQGALRSARLALPEATPRLAVPKPKADASGIVPGSSFPKKTFGVDKATGQFKRVYTSESAPQGAPGGVKVSDVASSVKTPQNGVSGANKGVYRYTEKPAPTSRGTVPAKDMEPVSQEVSKYKSAADFAKSLVDSPSGGKAIKMELPIGKLTTSEPSMAYSRLKGAPTRKVTEPIEVIKNVNPQAIKDYGEYVLVDGHHRLMQAKLNGDKTIKAVVSIIDETEPGMQTNLLDDPTAFYNKTMGKTGAKTVPK